jgi:hypothetical protein
VKKLNILTIRTDGGTQPRLELDQELVKDYAEKMRDGAVFPPIVVFNDGSESWLADGFTRFFATKSNGGTSIEAEIHQGTLRDAKMYARKANNKQGRPLTSNDIRGILFDMFADEEYGAWSNNKIAKELDLSSMTVGRARVAYQDKSKTPKQPVSYTDKHGKQKTMNTENIGKTKKERPTTKPDHSLGALDPASELTQKVNELSNTVTTLAEENTALRDQIAIGQWDATEIEKVDAEETIKELREQVRVLEIENKSLRESRDMYQNRNAELMRSLKSANAKLKKLEG